MYLLIPYHCENNIPSTAKLEEQRKLEPKYEVLINKKRASPMCCLSQAETSELSSCAYPAVMNDTSQVSFAIKVN